RAAERFRGTEVGDRRKRADQSTGGRSVQPRARQEGEVPEASAVHGAAGAGQRNPPDVQVVQRSRGQGRYSGATGEVSRGTPANARGMAAQRRLAQARASRQGAEGREPAW